MVRWSGGAFGHPFVAGTKYEVYHRDLGEWCELTGDMVTELVDTHTVIWNPTEKQIAKYVADRS